MKIFFGSFIIFLISVISIFPCTTAVVSGKATDDGRPLLLKNRDADALQNKLVYFFDGKYRFIGLVNSEDKENKDVWCGFNAAGFGTKKRNLRHRFLHPTQRLDKKQYSRNRNIYKRWGQ
mgnify:CR=1 FL=1